MNTPAEILFILFSAGMLACAVGVITGRNQVNSAMLLVASFFFLAADYAILSAHLLAVLQVLVYAGAIVVLFLFVIMLLSFEQPKNDRIHIGSPAAVLSILTAVGIGLVMVAVTMDGSSIQARVSSVRDEPGGQVAKFSISPFRQSAFTDHALGTVELVPGKDEIATTLNVMSVGMGSSPDHHLVPLGTMKLRANDIVNLHFAAETVTPAFGTVGEVGLLLYSRYLLPFEVTSLLLLVAIVGAVVVAKGKI